MHDLTADNFADPFQASRHEWLLTNGLGGYASSSAIGMNTRRYHGLLVAATEPPTVRMVLLSKLEGTLIVDGARYELSANQYRGVVHPQGYRWLQSFRLDQLPTWTWALGGVELEKTVGMVYGENTTVVRYALRGIWGAPATLEVRPLIAFRDYHALTHENGGLDRSVRGEPGLATLAPYTGMPALHLAHDAAHVDTTGDWYRQFEYARDQERGQDCHEDLYQPLTLTFDLTVRPSAVVIASTDRSEPGTDALALALLQQETERRAALIGANAPVARTAPSGRRTAPAPPLPEMTRSLTLAADQFIVRRGEDKSVIAGYPWFTDWSRDTMISLPGLTLATGRPEIARSILRAFARYVDEGMLPNRFPDRGAEPEYNTVDGTLWYFAAIDSWLRYTGDIEFVRAELWPVLTDIVDWHVRGTRYGIGVDVDGLLRAGASGVQLTWMDARIGDWVVTPRRGKPVEIQALWYNALRLSEELAKRFGDAERARNCAAMAARAKRSFTARFWNAQTGCLYDVVDAEGGDDGSIRPNQAIALGLRHTMVGRDRALAVLDVLDRELLTPVGMRTLASSDPRYRGRYEGDMVERDARYHQGAAWPWLIGPYFDACVRFRGAAGRAAATAWLAAYEPRLWEAGLGQAPELYDGDAPHRPAGCIAQAWSVAELLRIAALVAGLGCC